eukprot:scaffold82313_cov39-Cyclotella_meneghiniana.AAC.2
MCHDKTDLPISLIPTPSANITAQPTKVQGTSFAILDSGASRNYLTEKAPTENKRAIHDQIRVTLPDGTTLKSYHQCSIQNKQLPPKAREAYIIPGCKVQSEKDKCNVIYNNTIVMKGYKNDNNGLWYVPLKNQHNQEQQVIIQDNRNVAANAQHTSTMAETIQFLHQCLFSLTVDTLCKAIDNDQLIGFPHLTSAMVRKYLPESTATAKGHMKQIRRNTRSTTMNPTPEEIIELDLRPKIDENSETELFIGATIGEQNDRVIYSNETGNFPVQSYHPKQIMMVIYEYRSNAIIVKALKTTPTNQC